MLKLNSVHHFRPDNTYPEKQWQGPNLYQMSDTIVSKRALTISSGMCAGVLVFGGRNNISLGAQDGRPFAVFARICERRSPAEVKALMPPPETIEAALHRVKRSVRIIILAVSDNAYRNSCMGRPMIVGLRLIY